MVVMTVIMMVLVVVSTQLPVGAIYTTFSDVLCPDI